MIRTSDSWNLMISHHIHKELARAASQLLLVWARNKFEEPGVLSLHYLKGKEGRRELM